MLKVVNAEEMRAIDNYAIEKVGLPGVVLMENAGRATFRVIQQMLGNTPDPLVYIFCGKGNNGGDGFVVARHLWNEGIYVRVFCIVPEKELSGDALTNYNILHNMNIPIEFVSSTDQLREVENEPPHILVDALLGTGLKGPAKGFVKEVIDFLNQNVETRILSIDLPSGLNADSPQVPGSAIRADVTVTMALPKRCHVLFPAKNYVGENYVVEIGIPPFVVNKPDIKLELLEQGDIVLPFRYPDAHKYECGKVAILAGSKGYTGAAALCAQAALKTGAGMVILAVPESINAVMEQKLTEVINRPVPETAQQTIGPESMETIEELLEWCDVLAIGPGLGRSEAVRKAVIATLEKCDKPVVIDADALWALAQDRKLLEAGDHRNWILTPHFGEFSRFFPGEDKENLAIHRIEIAQAFAREYNLTLLLKGNPALVAMPDERVYINSTGNAGLASAGTGDVLTGITVGLLAQGFDPDEAAYTANFVHGFAADHIVERETIYGLTAGDLINNLGFALKSLQTGQQGSNEPAI
ncbi:MAG TPA: NAD(P)H-hydrate dehydratase [Calditrichia bacterium]|nr:NAD(P)H-hydrate dehydratase [Calditrichota bacterium]HQU72373.1 NAD(P)H-hydrate dehydratase [Calditrichia bacterium]HQV30719.1 NAD(P)H-hydrate dehydratase [Calditrichia bacterium]